MRELIAIILALLATIFLFWILVDIQNPETGKYYKKGGEININNIEK